MHRVAMLVGACAPGIIPQAAPVRLLLETYNFGNFGAFPRSGLKSPELCEPRWTSSNHRDATFHAENLPKNFHYETNFTAMIMSRSTLCQYGLCQYVAAQSRVSLFFSPSANGALLQPRETSILCTEIIS